MMKHENVCLIDLSSTTFILRKNLEKEDSKYFTNSKGQLLRPKGAERIDQTA
jgi:hypothetical protein